MPGGMQKFLDKMRGKKKEKRILVDLSGGERRCTDDYEIKDTLGKGTFSEVKLGVHRKNGRAVAVKHIDKNNIGIKASSLRTEVEVLQRVGHPAIVNLLDVYEDDDTVYMVMDLMLGGELFDRICEAYPMGYSEKASSKIMARILDAIDYLHGKGIIHRDLKPENLLYAQPGDDEDIKISDFGLAKIWKSDIVAKTACGSPNYVAPEVLLNDGSGYTAAVDMWSIGVILYVLLCGFCPFYDEKTPVLFRLITTGTYSFPSPYWDNISESAKDLIKHLLCVDPTKRFSAKQALEHEWIKANNSDKPIEGFKNNWDKFKAARGRGATNDDERKNCEVLTQARGN